MIINLIVLILFLIILLAFLMKIAWNFYVGVGLFLVARDKQQTLSLMTVFEVASLIAMSVLLGLTFAGGKILTEIGVGLGATIAYLALAVLASYLPAIIFLFHFRDRGDSKR